MFTINTIATINIIATINTIATISYIVTIVNQNGNPPPVFSVNVTGSCGAAGAEDSCGMGV